jgi:hypothetical protein
VIAQPPLAYGIDGFNNKIQKNFPDSSKLKAPGPKIDKKVLESRAFDPSEFLCNNDSLWRRSFDIATAAQGDGDEAPSFDDIVIYAETGRMPWGLVARADAVVDREIEQRGRQALIQCSVQSNFDDQGRKLLRTDEVLLQSCVREAILRNPPWRPQGCNRRCYRNHDADTPQSALDFWVPQGAPERSPNVKWLAALHITEMYYHFCPKRMDSK